jgi:hypothetical protein
MSRPTCLPCCELCGAFDRTCSFACSATCPRRRLRRRSYTLRRHCKLPEETQVLISCSIVVRARYSDCTSSSMMLAGFQRGRYASEGQPSTIFAIPSPLHSTKPRRSGGSLFLCGEHAAGEFQHPTSPLEAHTLRCMVHAAKAEVFLADGSRVGAKHAST